MKHITATKRSLHRKNSLQPGPRGPQQLDSVGMFSFFDAPVSNKVPSCEMSVRRLVKLIRGPRYQEITNRVRFLKSSGRDDAAKRVKTSMLPYVTFAGVFTARKNDAVVTLSGLMCFDFDHIKNPERLKQKLSDDENIVMMFTSPSGDGLKVIYIDPLEEDDYKSQYEVLKEYFKKEYRIDADKTSDISRACFICHDPEVWCKFKF